ncbi:hypothetical protein JCGZ_04145 [Jatropha curcas]|uniref:Uncharacterized protein n=1 Tax=Jatropha curcas TaxID=180498 RepID=A0A067KTC9_JATCU|nr:hypothetical protein JCGZ_04145 [Jatropha curcas]
MGREYPKYLVKMVGISWQFFTQIQDFLLGTGVLPGTVWGVPGSGRLEALEVWDSQHGRALAARAKFLSPVHARACALARPGACISLEVSGSCGMGMRLSMGWGMCASASLLVLPCIWHGRAD